MASWLPTGTHFKSKETGLGRKLLQKNSYLLVYLINVDFVVYCVCV